MPYSILERENGGGEGGGIVVRFERVQQASTRTVISARTLSSEQA